MTRPYRVYIAAASVPSEIERVERWAAALIEAGIEVISTWPRNIREVGSANPRDATTAQRWEWAVTCLHQVAQADALWFMTPPPGVHTRGAWCELNAARYGGQHIVCSGDTKQSIFTALGDEYETDEQAFGCVHELALSAGDVGAEFL